MINLAVIGIGIWGQRHVRSARSSGRFNVTMAVDPDSVRAAPVAEELGLTFSSTIEDALSNKNIDAVSLATPHTLHTSQIIEAARAGKHIYTEKPFALNVNDARRSVATVEEANVVLALGHDQRQYPVVNKLKEMIAEETFGKILHIETNLSHDSMKLLYLKDRENTDASTQRVWRLDEKEAPTGPISQFGIHRVDTFINLLGTIDWVFAAGSFQALDPSFLDTVSVTVGFRNGVIGYLGNSLATPLYSRLHILGTEKWAESTGPKTFDEYRECSLTNLTIHSKNDRENYSFDIIDSVEKNFASFADAIEGTAPFSISTNQMVHNIAVVDAINESLETGNRVPVTSG